MSDLFGQKSDGDGRQSLGEMRQAQNDPPKIRD